MTKRYHRKTLSRSVTENERIGGEELVMPEYCGMLQVFGVDMSRVTFPRRLILKH